MRKINPFQHNETEAMRGRGMLGRHGNRFNRLRLKNSGTAVHRPIIAAFSALLLAGALRAEAGAPERITYAFYPYPPIAMMAGERRSGYATEIMTEVLRRAGFETQETDLPGLRALVHIERETGIFISGTKTPEAYDKYAVSWPFCFETVTHSAIVPANRGFNTFAELPRDARIGAFISYTLKGYLEQQGFTNFQFAHENHQLAKMLMNDRIDAWASFDSSARFLLEEMGVDLKSIRSLPIRQFSFCAVTSRKTERSTLDRVKAAYKSMLTDGSRAAIRARYQRYLGPDLPPDPATWEERPER